ncbi:MAG: STAS/SEC14 domain-containing protein [Cytophagales bacterium]|nr:STAS/SEC14 domain-containing protein [Cytophagales bacterium]
MTKQLITESYLTCHYDETVPVVAHRWSGYVKSEAFRSGIQQCLAEYAKIKQSAKLTHLHWLCNATDLKVLQPADSDWVNNEFARELYQNGVRRIAMIVPKDVFAKMATTSFGKSVDKQQQQGGITDTIVQYFDSEEKAKQWLKQAVEVVYP